MSLGLSLPEERNMIASNPPSRMDTPAYLAVHARPIRAADIVRDQKFSLLRYRIRTKTLDRTRRQNKGSLSAIA